MTDFEPDKLAAAWDLIEDMMIRAGFDDDELPTLKSLYFLGASHAAVRLMRARLHGDPNKELDALGDEVDDGLNRMVPESFKAEYRAEKKGRH